MTVSISLCRVKLLADHLGKVKTDSTEKHAINAQKGQNQHERRGQGYKNDAGIIYLKVLLILSNDWQIYNRPINLKTY